MRLSHCLFFALSVAHATASNNVWDYAPSFAADSIQPYPALTDANGNNLTAENLRGTRLFGFKGCTVERAKLIKQAFDDFHTLTSQADVYGNIDWNSDAAIDFWGPATGPNKIPDATRQQITQIFQAAQQMYSHWWAWEPPWLSWSLLWIEVSWVIPSVANHDLTHQNVRCSDGRKGDGAPDPLDSCGDAVPDRAQCPNGRPLDAGGKATLQAFSNPQPDDGRYSRITFCTDFFKLQELSVAVANGKARPPTEQRTLSRWDNQARCMLHEITHLDFFMNAGDNNKSPFVTDVEIYTVYRSKGSWVGAYGPANAHILAKYIDVKPERSGFYTQRNADSYAFFALAKYVEKQIGQYPNIPSAGKTVPRKVPRDVYTGEEFDSLGASAIPDSTDGDLQDPPDNGIYPGCGDKYGPQVPASVESASISSKFANPTSIPTQGPSASALPLPNCASTGLAFPQPPVEDFINQFCGQQQYWNTVLTPSISFGTGKMSDGRGKATGVSNSYDLVDSSDKLLIAMMVTRVSCFGTWQFTIGANDAEKLDYCKKRFRTVLNGCQTDTTSNKLGGMLQETCIEYYVERQPAGPTRFDDWYHDQGSFTCQDMSAFGSGGASSLTSTCLCWYRGYADLTAVFKMPASGNCKDTDPSALLSNS